MRKIVSMLFALGFLFCIGGRSLAQASDNFGELNIKLGGQGFLPKKQLVNKNTIPEVKAQAADTAKGITAKEAVQESTEEDKFKMNPGFSGTLEYLILGENFGLDFLKVGIGVSYLHKRGVKKVDPPAPAAGAPAAPAPAAGAPAPAAGAPAAKPTQETVKSAAGKLLDDFSTLIPVYLTLQINPLASSSSESLHGIFIKGNFGYDLLFKINDYKGKDKIKKKGGIMYGGSVGYEFPFGLIADVGYNAYKFGNTKLEGGDALTGSNNKFTYSTVCLNLGYKLKI